MLVAGKEELNFAHPTRSRAPKFPLPLPLLMPATQANTSTHMILEGRLNVNQE